MNEFRKLLLKNHITPKWVIFLLDLFICVMSFLYAHYLFNDLSAAAIDVNRMLTGVMLVGVSAAISFYLFKTYEGIIRFSEMHEAVRAFGAVFASFSSLFFLNFIFSWKNLPAPINDAVLFIYLISAGFVLCGYRIFVKTLYNADVQGSDAENVIIYGAENKGSFLHRAIGRSALKSYKVVAFIDADEQLVGKTIDNIRIYHRSGLARLIRVFRVKFLFFSEQDLDLDIKAAIVDECLANHVKVMNIPPVHNWIQGHINLNQLKEVKIEELLGRPAIELYNPAVVNFISHRNILITGAAGSIGSELARQVAAMNPASLIICDQLETGLYNLEYELQRTYNLGNRLKFYVGDVKDAVAMEQLFQAYTPGIVFHAAAYKHVPMMEQHPSEAICNNLLGTKIVADLSERYQVERFLFVSTDKAINPTNIMGASKRLAEMYCQTLQYREHEIAQNAERYIYRLQHHNQKTKFITTRFGNVLASNGSVIPRFREQIANGGPVTVTHPDIIRYFMTISEACSLVLEAVTMGKGGEIFLFDMGEPVKILDLAKKMIQLAGYEPGKDIGISFTGLRQGEKLYEELLNKEEEVIPTHHKKILIAKTTQTDYKHMAVEIESLISLAADYQDEAVVKQMKKILPEFISNNSVYAMYDKTGSAYGVVSDL